MSLDEKWISTPDALRRRVRLSGVSVDRSTRDQLRAAAIRLKKSQGVILEEAIRPALGLGPVDRKRGRRVIRAGEEEGAPAKRTRGAAVATVRGGKKKKAAPVKKKPGPRSKAKSPAKARLAVATVSFPLALQKARC